MDRFKAYLADQAKQRRDDLESGMLKDHAAYQVLCAELRLLRDINRWIVEAENEEDFEDG